MKDRDVIYMKQALNFAHEALALGEVPIGALVVSPEGEVLGVGYNKTEQEQCQSRHAEVCAIEAACGKVGDWRLAGCTIYITLEPCMMCISLIALSRIERVVYGTASPIFGYHLDKEGVLALYTKNIKNITEGVLAEQAASVLQVFFKKKRKVKHGDGI